LFGGLAQHHQVAHVVGHLVHQHGQRGDHAQPQVRHEGRGDQDAVAEGMHAVAGQHGPAARPRFGVPVAVMVVRRVHVPGMVMLRMRRHFGAVMFAAMVLMAVVPEFGLVEQEKEDQPHQQGSKQLLGAGLAFKSLR
jgi:hypothetical protein